MEQSTQRLMYTAALTLLICLSGGLAAETLTLKNGQVLRGKVVGQSRTEIRLQTPEGVRVVKKADIRRISYDSPEETEDRRRAEAERRKQEQAEAEREQRQTEAEARKKQEEASDSNGPVPPETRGLSYTGFALRNAVLPGWGFFANDRPGPGAAYAALTAGAVYYAWTTRQAALTAKDENFAQVQLNTLLTLVPNGVDSGTRLGFGFLANQSAYGPYQSKIEAHNQSLQILGLVYFAQLAHTAALASGWPTPGALSLGIPGSNARLEIGLVGIASPGRSAGREPIAAPLIGAGVFLRF
ncbi:MAG: hypothetical protein RIF32_06485 [Leptospirales bacterium]|jgi:hypothetical protein